MKKILVVYYSRTGNTKKVGDKIAEILNADIDEVIDNKKRRGIIGWLGAGKDASMKKDTEIDFDKNPSDYDLVVVGTPVWAWTLTPAVKTYLEKNKDNIKRIAFFCTHGGNPGKIFNEMEKLSKKPITTIEILDKEINSCDDKIKEFCEKIK